MEKISLFKNIKEEDVSSLLQCVNAVTKHYKKYDIIFLKGEKPLYIGVVLEGQVNIVNDELSGRRIVINTIEKNGVFGEAFVCSEAEEYTVTAEASRESKILLIPYKNIIRRCSKSCDFHNQIIQNLITTLSKRNMYLNDKISCITQKDIMSKVAYYLINKYKIEKNLYFTIPLNREELAEYLNVNRSALSRELSKLRKDNIINFSKNRFEILDLDTLEDLLL
ncbi:MAG: Crp/Fnr family transcriptional regulator [Lachnospirales bacterium]